MGLNQRVRGWHPQGRFPCKTSIPVSPVDVQWNPVDSLERESSPVHHPLGVD